MNLPDIVKIAVPQSFGAAAYLFLMISAFVAADSFGDARKNGEGVGSALNAAVGSVLGYAIILGVIWWLDASFIGEALWLFLIISVVKQFEKSIAKRTADEIEARSNPHAKSKPKPLTPGARKAWRIVGYASILCIAGGGVFLAYNTPLGWAAGLVTGTFVIITALVIFSSAMDKYHARRARMPLCRRAPARPSLGMRSSTPP